MQPRDRGEAGRIILTLTAVASTVTLVQVLLSPDAAGRAVDLLIEAPILLVLVAGSWLIARGGQDGPRRMVWAIFPFLGLVGIVALDLYTGDASAAAQVFLLFPALYAASQVPRSGAIAVTVVTAACDAVIAFRLLPLAEAITDVTYVVAAIAASAALLVRAAERREVVVEQLRHQAAVDPLTGLVTRRVLEAAAQAALSGAADHSGTALIVLDIDRFKAVNDAYGHLAGDEVLVQIAGILLNLSRPEDTVSRLGGDEIALLLPACAAPVAHSRAELIRSTTANHVFVVGDGVELRMTVSVGLGHAPSPHFDLRSLYAEADAALYEAKRGGRNQVRRRHDQVLSHRD